MKKALLVRLDKIGDLVCTLPADQIVPVDQYEVMWVVQKGLGAVVDLGSRNRKYIEIDKNDHASARAALRVLIQNFKPDIAISFQCPWWVNFEFFLARIPIRGGVKSQWHSFLFLNEAIRQKRSESIQHELQYNIDLVSQTLGVKSNKLYQFFEIKKPNTSTILKSYGLLQKKYIVVHAGMAGSALNWPQKNYIQYIQELLNAGYSVVLTGTAGDQAYLTEILAQFKSHPEVYNFVSQHNLPELVEVLSHCQFLVAPSTGVLHLAAGLGVKVKGIYSPIRVHHPTRWGPRGPQTEVYVPDVKCPAQFECLKEACNEYNCMAKIKISVPT